MTTSRNGVIPGLFSRKSSARNGTTLDKSPSKMSVFTPRSCASSITTTEYFLRSKSLCISFKSTPSVMNFILVVFELAASWVVPSRSVVTFLSYLTWYPTSSPSFTFNSSATLVAVEVTATLLGCVTAIAPGCAAQLGSPYPASNRRRKENKVSGQVTVYL